MVASLTRNAYSLRSAIASLLRAFSDRLNLVKIGMINENVNWTQRTGHFCPEVHFPKP